MEEPEYKEKLNKIEQDYKKAKNDLHIEFAMSQAIFKVGDIIKDNRWTIKVDKITTYIGFGLPEPVYNGPELKKDLKPKANGNREAIYGNKGVELVEKA